MNFGKRLLSLIVLLALSSVASGFIMRIYPLKEVLDASNHIVVGRVDRVDMQKLTAEAVIDRTLKGKNSFKRIKMNFAVGAAGHGRYMIQRMKVGQPIMFFYQQNGASIACCGHVGDRWFQLFANDNPKHRDRLWWRFTHVEVYMGRTFNGKTSELIKLTADVVAGRVKSPEPDPTAPKVAVVVKSPRKVAQASGGNPGAKPAAKVGGFHRRQKFAHNGGSEIRGVSWVDVNGDERLDVYLCRRGGNLLLVNEGKTFREAAGKFGLATGSRSASWADFNGDDHPDLLTSNFQLFANIGGQMRDESRLLAAPRSRNPEGSGWIDYNGDGLPDVLITNGEHGIRLYENTGKGPQWFRDVSDKAGLGSKGLARGNGDFVTFLDYDGDGYTDFLYNLGRGVLVRNQGDGTFKLRKASGIQLRGGPNDKRGVAAADYDNDGDIDLFVPGSGKPQLYRNNNDGSFTDVFDACGGPTAEKDPSFAAAWGDVNCDGLLDLFICHTRGSSRLYLGDGKGHFKDVSTETGVRQISPAYGASLADVDADGDLDLVVNLPDRAILCYNEMARAKGFGPVTVGMQVRRGLVGAVVRATGPDGRLRGLRELSGAESCGGQTAPVAHFGLPIGKCTMTVCLSDGRAAGKTVTVKRQHTRITFRENEFK